MKLASGVDKLPEPVTEFHASFVSDSEVELAWEPVNMPDEDEKVIHYEIYFKELKNNSDSGSPFDHESVSCRSESGLRLVLAFWFWPCYRF